MITLDNDRLVFHLPEVHPKARFFLSFQRTLRIPDDGRNYPLPPGLGRFPLRHRDDYADRVPRTWSARGGVIMPMYQSEAMWIHFGGDYPFAVKIATGKINAVTGEDWSLGINRDPQDYVVVTEQSWLDGYCVESGIIRQFVAMPLGKGYTAEDQITGDGRQGGVQLIAYPMKAEAYNNTLKDWSDQSMVECCCVDDSMGLAPGGRMKQKIYNDPFSFDKWDLRHSSRCFVTIVNSIAWQAITRENPPHLPPSAKVYSNAGLPWFEFYGDDAAALEGSEKLKKLKSVTETGKQNHECPLPENESVNPKSIVFLGKK